MPNLPRACIFDLDGVIVDTARYHFLAWKQLAESLDIEFTETDNERLKGVSRMRSLEIILEIGNKQIPDEEKERVASQKNTQFRNYILNMTPEEILPGVKSFLDEIKQAGIKIALGSASKNAMTILKQVELEDKFDVIVDGNHVSAAKPDPEVFTKGASELHVPAEECIVFEDAIAGVEAAHNGNMLCIGIGDADTLSQADMIIPGFENFNLTKLAAFYQAQTVK